MDVNTPAPRAVATAVGIGVILFGCTEVEAPVEPEDRPPQPGEFIPEFDHAEQGSEQVRMLQRDESLDENILVEEWVGPAGGVIRIREAGLKVIFPEGAVKERVRITATAKEGEWVAYEFGPHGLEFAEDVKMEQDLKGTRAFKNDDIIQNLEAGYFKGTRNLEKSDGTMTVQEILPIEVDRANRNKIWYVVHHFSGYLVAAGRR